MRNSDTPRAIGPAPGRPAGRVRRIAAPWLVGGLALLTAAMPASAAEELVLIPDYALFGLIAGEPGIGKLWVMVIAFAVLVFPLNALMFRPIMRALDARAERIAGARARSLQLEAEADSVLERYETAIREARQEAEATRQSQLAGAREEQAELTTRARSEAENELVSARAELATSLEEARASLRSSTEELATAAAEQVLGRALS